MISEELWKKGYHLSDYLKVMEFNQKEMAHRVEDIRITSAEFQKLREFTQKRHFLVLAESWCKDCLMNIPIIAKIAEACVDVSLRIFPRSEFPELTNYFSQLGYSKVPLCWIVDESFNYCGHWMERPKSANRLIEKWHLENPELKELINNQLLSPEEKDKKIKPFSDMLLDDMWNWYDTRLQSETVDEFLSILAVQ